MAKIVNPVANYRGPKRFLWIAGLLIAGRCPLFGSASHAGQYRPADEQAWNNRLPRADTSLLTS